MAFQTIVPVLFSEEYGVCEVNALLFVSKNQFNNMCNFTGHSHYLPTSLVEITFTQKPVHFI